jgi:alkaline phosphatase D
MDQWSGYVAGRDRLLRFLQERRIPNPIVITGDVHQSWVAEIKADAADPGSATLGTEFVGTSISSGGDGQEMSPAGQAILADNPHVKYYNAQRGYVRCMLTPDRWQSDYRVVPYIARPDAAVKTHASFVVESGRPGVERA